jgi:soluble lytic murein transglycosylase-like protein
MRIQKGALGVGLAAVLCTAAGANTILLATSSSRLALFRSQIKLIDTRLSREYANSDRLQPKRADGSDGTLPRYAGSYRGAWYEQARTVARSHGVPEDLFLRLIERESNWNPSAVSDKGATGLAQLMPDTARLLNVDIADPKANLDGGARYLRMMFDRFGNWRLALAAYNAGPEAVDKTGGVPAFDETQAYVMAILGG